MRTNLGDKLNKLQLALNSKGCNLLVSKKQFYSYRHNCPMNMYIISQSVVDAESGRKKSVELFSSTNQVYCVLYLRNLWYLLNGMEIPETNIDDFNSKWLDCVKQNLFILPSDLEEEV